MKFAKFLFYVALGAILVSCDEKEELTNDETPTKNTVDQQERKIKEVFYYASDGVTIQGHNIYSYDGENLEVLSYHGDVLTEKAIKQKSGDKTTTTNYFNNGEEWKVVSSSEELYQNGKLVSSRSMDGSGFESSRTDYTYNDNGSESISYLEGEPMTKVIEKKVGNQEIDMTYIYTDDEWVYVGKTIAEFQDGKEQRSVSYDADDNEGSITVYTYSGESYSFINYSNGIERTKFEYLYEGDTFTFCMYNYFNGEWKLISKSVTVYE